MRLYELLILSGKDKTNTFFPNPPPQFLTKNFGQYYPVGGRAEGQTWERQPWPLSFSFLVLPYERGSVGCLCTLMILLIARDRRAHNWVPRHWFVPRKAGMHQPGVLEATGLPPTLFLWPV